MNTKAKGNRNERRTRDYYLERGYTVIKAGGSFGLFDLIAWNDTNIHYIQVKSSVWAAPAERKAMLKNIIPPNGVKVIHRWRNRVMDPDVWIIQHTQFCSEAECNC